MITLVLATMFAALICAWFRLRWLAAAAIAVCLILFVGEFLWEVWSPEYGFRMPWIQVEAEPAPGGGVAYV